MHNSELIAGEHSSPLHKTKAVDLCIYTSALVLCDIFELCMKLRANLNAQMFV